MTFDFISHTADVQMRIRAASISELFRVAAEGMMAYIFGEVDDSAASSEVMTCEVSGLDQEDLLVGWLSELLLLTQLHYSRVRRVVSLEIHDRTMKATVELTAAQAHEEIKAVTYHALRIHQDQAGFEALITFDL